MPPEHLKADCGSEQCLIDSLKQTVRQQHEDSQAFMEKLLDRTAEAICKQIDGVNSGLQKMGDELFRRMRHVEERVTVLETRIGPGEITSKISTEVNKNEDVIWMKQFRQRFNAVLIIVSAAAIISIAGSLFVLFDQHDVTLHKTSAGQDK